MTTIRLVDASIASQAENRGWLTAVLELIKVRLPPVPRKLCPEPCKLHQDLSNVIMIIIAFVKCLLWATHIL